MWKTRLQERLFVGWAQRRKINLKLVCEAPAASATGRVFFKILTVVAISFCFQNCVCVPRVTTQLILRLSVRVERKTGKDSLVSSFSKDRQHIG